MKKNNEALWIRTCDHLNAKVQLIAVTVASDCAMVWSSVCQCIRKGIIICYRLFSIFLIIDLSTVTKFTQYNPYSINLSGYCITVFHKLFLLFNYNLASKLRIWEIYIRRIDTEWSVSDISHVNLSLRFSWFPACIASIW